MEARIALASLLVFAGVLAAGLFVTQVSGGESSPDSDVSGSDVFGTASATAVDDQAVTGEYRSEPESGHDDDDWYDDDDDRGEEHDDDDDRDDEHDDEDDWDDDDDDDDDRYELEDRGHGEADDD